MDITSEKLFKATANRGGRPGLWLRREKNMFTNEQYTCLVNKYIDTVYRIALNYLKNRPDAEDVCQNVFLALLTEKKDFQSDEHLKNWLIRVTINECKKELRSVWHKKESLDDHIPSVSFTDPRQSDLYDSVMTLPRHYRVPLYLHYYEGYSTDEIGELLKIPGATVRTRLRRARQLLQNELEGVTEHV